MCNNMKRNYAQVVVCFDSVYGVTNKHTGKPIKSYRDLNEQHYQAVARNDFEKPENRAAFPEDEVEFRMLKEIMISGFNVGKVVSKLVGAIDSWARSTCVVVPFCVCIGRGKKSSDVLGSLLSTGLDALGWMNKF